MSTNPFTPGTSNPQPTPPWSEIIRMYCDAKAADIRVAIPCIVTAVKSTNRVSLQPLLMETYKFATSAVPLPIIQDALVGMPRGTEWFIKMPIAVGDTGLAIICDRSLDVFSASDGESPVDPVDTRNHNLSDAIFYPGLYPFSNTIDVGGPTDMVLQNGLAQLFLQAAGKFLEGNLSLPQVPLTIPIDPTVSPPYLPTVPPQTEPISSVPSETMAVINALMSELNQMLGLLVIASVGPLAAYKIIFTNAQATIAQIQSAFLPLVGSED